MGTDPLPEGVRLWACRILAVLCPSCLTHCCSLPITPTTCRPACGPWRSRTAGPAPARHPFLRELRVSLSVPGWGRSARVPLARSAPHLGIVRCRLPAQPDVTRLWLLPQVSIHPPSLVGASPGQPARALTPSAQGLARIGEAEPSLPGARRSGGSSLPSMAPGDNPQKTTVRTQHSLPMAI